MSEDVPPTAGAAQARLRGRDRRRRRDGPRIAYHLAQRGLTDVVVIERGYLAEGASGRNGGGVRKQWSTEINIRLMQESVELCRRFAGELGVNVWFRQGGYLFLGARARARAAWRRTSRCRIAAACRRACWRPPRRARIVPELDIAAIVGACYNPSDGILFPWPFLWGYARQAPRAASRSTLHRRHRASSATARGFRLRTSKGEVRATRVINAAGAWSPEVARLVGVELPNRPHRHEILSSEPLKPFLRRW